jgi:glycolate oxidase FAD binding subunit
VEFLRDDLTAIVEAGMTVKALNGLTLPEGQNAGFDPAHPGTATVGGNLIGDRSGPMRVRYGRAGDRFMRVRVALADGNSHTYGALVVKNVTGYDTIRLFAGSWGTLAVATELAVRLYKVPEALGARAAGFPDAEAAFGAARLLMATPLAPEWVEVFDAGRAVALKKWLQDIPLPGPWCLAAAFGEFEEGLDEPLLRLEEIAMNSGGKDLVRLGGENTRQLGEALANPPGTDYFGEETLAFRASGRLDQLPRFAAAAQKAAEAGGYRFAVAAHAGSGVLRCWLEREDGGGNAALAWRTFAAFSREGSNPERGRAVHVRVESGAEAIDAAGGAEGEVPLWGEDALDPVALDLMAKVKREYDPKRILSPGRFVGRL